MTNYLIRAPHHGSALCESRDEMLGYLNWFQSIGAREVRVYELDPDQTWWPVDHAHDDHDTRITTLQAEAHFVALNGRAGYYLPFDTHLVAEQQARAAILYALARDEYAWTYGWNYGYFEF